MAAKPPGWLMRQEIIKFSPGITKFGLAFVSAILKSAACAKEVNRYRIVINFKRIHPIFLIVILPVSSDKFAFTCHKKGSSIRKLID
jgi:hypothetical protein